MISIDNLSYSVSGRWLYERVCLQITPKDKIGLVGLNGTGKSTLLKLIEGSLSPEQGSLRKSKECSIGFLNQDLLSYTDAGSVRSVAMAAFAHAVEVQRQMEGLLQAMERNYDPRQVEQLTALQETFERLDGYTLQAKTDAVLEGIGFKSSDLERPFQSFSGGWRMRAILAKLLLQAPTLLMLDEPTNHLDISSVQWLETYLQSYGGAFIVVSHDRRFLDNVTEKTVEVCHAQLHAYTGNYSQYEQEKFERMQLQTQAYTNQQKQIKQTERFIERFRSKSTKARQVQSRIKLLDRMDKIPPALEAGSDMRVRMVPSRASGRTVALLEDIHKRFKDLVLLQGAQARIERQDKIALIGANGMGKSTLLRMTARVEPPTSGCVTWGHHVETAFYAQHQLEVLSKQHTVLEELQSVQTRQSDVHVRNVAAMFLFSGDDVKKSISVLSGGERARVALAKMLLQEANFLLLDEPTNHLDMRSIEVLGQTLQNYPGTLLFVSHDRHFIQRVATKIWYIENGKIKVYPGSYAEYTHACGIQSKAQR